MGGLRPGFAGGRWGLSRAAVRRARGNMSEQGVLREPALVRPAPRLDRLRRLDEGSAELVDRLLAVARTGLPGMQLPDGTMCFTRRFSAARLVGEPEGCSLRYTAIAALGPATSTDPPGSVRSSAAGRSARSATSWSTGCRAPVRSAMLRSRSGPRRPAATTGWSAPSAAWTSSMPVRRPGTSSTWPGPSPRWSPPAGRRRGTPAGSGPLPTAGPRRGRRTGRPRRDSPWSRLADVRAGGLRRSDPGSTRPDRPQGGPARPGQARAWPAGRRLQGPARDSACRA